MRVVHDVDTMQGVARARYGRVSTALVPTMGALHEGHLSLIRLARDRADQVDVTVFVNPAQFGPGEDLEQYPRPFEDDLAACRREGVATVFCPGAGQMYAGNHSTLIAESALSEGLCGRYRAGHFNGVVTVVAKLFNIMLPTVAVFGQKDYQQVCVIQRMVRDLDFPVEIVVAPIVREADGLAMSSRNRYLGADERARALALSQGLMQARADVAAGERDAHRLEQALSSALAEAGLHVQYAACVDADTLAPVRAVDRPTLFAVAVQVGTTRLIDNVILLPRAE